MKREYCVYMHTAPNGKRYIGITCCQPRNRRWQNGYGYVTQPRFYNAIKKYGWDNFEHTILEDDLTAAEAGEKEQEYISQYRTTDKKYGYNILVGGEVGYHLTDEQKEKISRANAGENNGMFGHHYTDEERKKMSELSVWRGRKHTAETRKKISEYLKAHPETFTHWGKDHPMAKAIIQYDKDGNFVARYDTAVEAAQKTGASRSGICTCAKGRIKTSNGYMWRYQETLTEDNIDPVIPRKQRIKPVAPHKFNPHSIRRRKVSQYTTRGELIKTFNSISDANISLGLRADNGGVSGVLRGRRKTAHGYIWRYADGD